MNAGISHAYGTVSQASAELRALFIAKVYGLLFAGLVVSVLAGAFALSAGITVAAFFPLFIAGMVCIFALGAAKRVPVLNFALYFLFTVIEGAMLAPYLALVSARQPGILMQASATTLAVFGALSLYVFISRKDFGFLGGMLFVGLIGMIVAGLVMMFFPVSVMATVYSLFGVLLFSGFVLYDTSQIINRLNPDEVVTGAIELYLDFVNLFLYILRLFSNRN